ncbi:MAG: hypothetical protein EBZ61_11855 [Micrococcales bacterium]|nr:hypothetical protein [Micrococcales bacterium]
MKASVGLTLRLKHFLPAEAKSDLFYLADLGIKSIVCPMVETAFAMEKYMQMLSTFHFEHVAVTIETVTAVANLESILDAGAALTEVTIGRTDLTASFKGEGVESERTMDMVKLVARAARNRNLKVPVFTSSRIPIFWRFSIL